jgi:hypothetical protein
MVVTLYIHSTSSWHLVWEGKNPTATEHPHFNAPSSDSGQGIAANINSMKPGV